MKLSVTTQQHNSQVQAQLLCCLFCLLPSNAAQGQACILVHKLWNRHKRYTAHRFKLRVSKYRCATEADRNAKVPLRSCSRWLLAIITQTSSHFQDLLAIHLGIDFQYIIQVIAQGTVLNSLQSKQQTHITSSCLQGLSLLAANLLLTAERAVDVCHQCRNESCCLV